MSWESRLLDACKQLKESSGKLKASIERLEADTGLRLGGDISPAQLPGLYRLAHELTRPELPPTELLCRKDLDALQQALADRSRLLQARQDADQQLQTAISNSLSKLGVPRSEAVAHETRRRLYRLANELVKPDLPKADLVFHGQLDRLARLLKQRSELLNDRDVTLKAIESRSFNRTLLDRLDLDAVEKAWSQASASFWPLSILKKWGVEKKLKTYAKASAIPDPDLDLPLLREYRDSVLSLTKNLESLGLGGELSAMVESNPEALDDQLEAAAGLRDAILTTGGTIDDAAAACERQLEPLVAAARQLYPPGRELEATRVQLRENLAELGLTPEYQERVEEDASNLDSDIETANQLRELTQALGIPNDTLGDFLQSVAAAADPVRRESATECCRSAKAFQAGWQEYTSQAGLTPVPKDSTSVAGDAIVQAQTVLSGRTQLKQWTAWTGAKTQAEDLGLEGFVEALQSGAVPLTKAVEQFELAYARWWLKLAVDRSEPLRTFQRYLHEDAIVDFQHLDELAMRAAPPRVRQAVLHDLPATDKVPGSRSWDCCVIRWA